MTHDGRPRPATHSGEGAAGRTVFAPGSRINAQVKANELVLEGFFDGDVRARSVRLEASGEANATLRCDAATILGRFGGTIEARVLLFGPAAVAQGVFEADRIAMLEGAIVSGSFNVDAADRTSAAPPRSEAKSVQLGSEGRKGVEALAGAHAVPEATTA